jgi:hypothetical protein
MKPVRSRRKKQKHFSTIMLDLLKSIKIKNSKKIKTRRDNQILLIKKLNLLSTFKKQYLKKKNLQYLKKKKLINYITFYKKFPYASANYRRLKLIQFRSQISKKLLKFLTLSEKKKKNSLIKVKKKI